MVGADTGRSERPARPVGLAQQRLQRALWQTRLIILVAVAASVMLPLCLLYVTTVAVVHLVGTLGSYTDAGLSGEARGLPRTTILAGAVSAVDGYRV